MQFITSIIATISLLSLAIYDFLCICRIIGKETLVEKLWNRILPQKSYDEKKIFLFIRPMFLHVWFITFVLSGGVLGRIPWYNLFCLTAPVLSAGVVLRNIKEKDEND